MRAKFPILVLTLSTFLLLLSMIFMSISSAYTRKSSCFKADKELQKAHGLSTWYSIILAFALVSTVSITYIYIKWTTGNINWSRNTTSLTGIIILGVILLFLLAAIIISSSVNSIYINHSKCKDEDIHEAYKWSNICWIMNAAVFISLGACIGLYIWKKREEIKKGKTEVMTGQVPQSKEERERAIKKDTEKFVKLERERRRQIANISPETRKKLATLDVTSESPFRERAIRTRTAPGRGAQMAPGRGAQMAPGKGAQMAPGRGAAQIFLEKRQKPEIQGRKGGKKEAEELFPLGMPVEGGVRETLERVHAQRMGQPLESPFPEFRMQGRGAEQGGKKLITEAKQEVKYPDYRAPDEEDLYREYTYLTPEHVTELYNLLLIAPKLRSFQQTDRIQYLTNRFDIPRYLRNEYPGLESEDLNRLKSILLTGIGRRTSQQIGELEKLKEKNREGKEVIKSIRTGSFFEDIEFQGKLKELEEKGEKREEEEGTGSIKPAEPEDLQKKLEKLEKLEEEESGKRTGWRGTGRRRTGRRSKY